MFLLFTCLFRLLGLNVPIDHCVWSHCYLFCLISRFKNYSTCNVRHPSPHPPSIVSEKIISHSILFNVRMYVQYIFHAEKGKAVKMAEWRISCFVFGIYNSIWKYILRFVIRDQVLCRSRLYTVFTSSTGGIYNSIWKVLFHIWYRLLRKWISGNI